MDDGELLGREREVRALLAFAGLREGGGVALVHGPAGIGKTALLGAVAEHARAEGLTVLRAEGARAETALPYAALERLLRGLLAGGGADALPAPQREALRGALGLGADAVSDVFLVGLATLNLLAGAGGERRVVAIVDDARWLDAATADVLAFVARRIADEPVALVIARREGHLDLPAALDVALEPLNDEAARALAERTAASFSPAARRRLLAVAAGNPLALAELPRVPGALDGPADAVLPLTARLERSFTAQAAGLPETTRALLRTAALDDAGLATELLAATPGATEDDLGAAVGAGLLERDGPHVRFRHPLMRSAIHQATTEAQRRATHAAIAALPSLDRHRRAWHRAAATAGTDDAVAADLDAAAQDARRRGAPAVAARALDRAATLSTDPAGAVERLLGAAELLAEVGEAAKVRELVDRAERLGPGAHARLRISAIAETYATDVTTDAAPVRALVEQAARARTAGDADLALRLLLAAGTRCWWAMPADAPVREEVVAETLRAAPSPDDPRALAVLAAASAVRHAGLLVERLTRACERPAPDPLDAHLLGQAAHMAGESELAVRQLARVEAAWRAEGRLALLAQALVMRAWSSIQLGNWPVVEPAAAEADRLARETGQPLWGAGARAALAAVAGVRGDHVRAAALAADVEAQLVAVRPTNVFAVLQVARTVTALGAGRFGEAYDQAARMFDPADHAHHYAERHGGLSYLAEAALQCGRTAEARATLAAVASATADDASRATLAVIGIGVAVPLLSDPDANGATDAAFAAALGGEAGRPPFHRARLLLAQGARLRRARRAAESRAPLRTARDLFDALGAIPWAERARHELRASGETSRRRTPDARDQLTPQELQVAQLAADGLSNPEIGERLFLSPRTVASHLYRAFPKLGIASRRELAAALGDAMAS